jgi:hypothetical protein
MGTPAVEMATAGGIGLNVLTVIYLLVLALAQRAARRLEVSISFGTLFALHVERRHEHLVRFMLVVRRQGFALVLSRRAEQKIRLRLRFGRLKVVLGRRL